MGFAEFGKIVEQAPEPGSFPEFGTKIEPPSRFMSLVGAPVKGAFKKAADIAELVQKMPLPKGPFNPEKAREFAEEKFPTYEKGPEKFLERAGGLGVEALLSPGGPLVKGAQILGGAALGHTAEALGAPDWAQSIAESLPFFYRGGKKIPLKADQKKLGEFLRKQGLTENEITPLLKTPEQISRWSKWASKGKKSGELMQSVYNKTGHIYDGIIADAKNLPPLSEPVKINLLKEMSAIIEEMPAEYRKLIKQDATDFVTKGRAGIEDLVNFDKDINTVIGAQKGGRAMVGRLKEPIRKAMESVSPALAQDYQLAKDLYRTRANVAGHILTRKQMDEIMDVGEVFALGAGVFNRDIGTIGKVIGALGARKLAREMLINPRLQNISVRVGEALKKNKYMFAEKLMQEFKDEIAKEDPELAESLP